MSCLIEMHAGHVTSVVLRDVLHACVLDKKGLKERNDPYGHLEDANLWYRASRRTR